MGADRSFGECAEPGRVADCGAGLVAYVGPLVSIAPLNSEVTGFAVDLALRLTMMPPRWRIMGIW